MKGSASNLSSGDKITIHNKRYESTNSDYDLGSPSIYVEERVKLLKNNQYSHVYKSLKELCKQIKEFKVIYSLSLDDQKKYFQDKTQLRKGLNISFENDEHITQIARDDQFKINTRSVLGVKNTNDWIYGLNIGNIMHLTPFEYGDVQKDLTENDSNDKVIKELTSDSILENIIYLASAYFCIATEYRFLFNKVDPKKYSLKMSEMWHAKAVHTSS